MEPEGKRLQDRKDGNCRGPGTQERLIQLIGDPVLAPAVPKRLSTQGRWKAGWRENERSGALGYSCFWPNPSLRSLP